MKQSCNAVLLISFILCFKHANSSWDEYDEADSDYPYEIGPQIDDCKFEKGRFLCKGNHTCIDLNNVCDGTPDCPDQSDEDEKCNKYKDCMEKVCPEGSMCYSLPETGHGCLCQKAGYKYSSSNNTCDDINECEIFGSCSQHCVNTNGSYYCICEENFEILSDKKTCVVKENKFLMFYTSKNNLNVFTFTSSKAETYTIDQSSGKKIAVAFDGKNVFWVNKDERRIDKGQYIFESSSLVNPITHITAGLKEPNNLESDWLTKNIYFSDDASNQIVACSPDGINCMTVIFNNEGIISGIALDPRKGVMYWTILGQNPMISTASMDGSDQKILISSNLGQITGITFDSYTERLYWIDMSLHTIETARSDGTDRHVIRSSSYDISGANAIAVFENIVYLSLDDSNDLFGFDKFTGYHIFKRNLGYINNFSIYHPAYQPKLEHSCQKRHCSHLCLLKANNSSVCGCPSGMSISADKINCKNHIKKVVFIILKKTIFEIELSASGQQRILGEHILPLFIHRVALNSVNSTIFVADNTNQMIKEYNPRARTLVTLVEGNLGNITGLEFDSFAQNLYWTDAEQKVLEVFSLITKQRVTLQFYKNAEVPIGLGLVPDKGKILVALESEDQLFIHDKTAGGHGVVEKLAVEDDGIFKIYRKTASKEIYWIDLENGKIDHSTMHDSLNFPIFTERQYLSSIFFDEDDFFWTNTSSRFLYWNFRNNIGKEKKFEIQQYKNKDNPRSNVKILPNRQRVVQDHPCLQNNGGCSHFCISSGINSSICLCLSELVLQDDNKMCIESPECRFRCKSGKCLATSKFCNGRKDCDDGSDEENCESFFKSCTTDQNLFLCQNGESCIELDTVCNGRPNCPDRSDENGKCDRIKDCLNSDCPQESTCFSTPSEVSCQCFPGFKYNNNTNKCEDINECEIFGMCSQGCINTKGSYSCHCYQNYTLMADNRTCVVEHGEAVLFFTSRDTISKLNLISKWNFTSKDTIWITTGVVFNGVNTFYFSMGEGLVKADENGTNREVLISSGLHTPDSIALDWLTGNIYICDQEEVKVCSSDGENCLKLMKFQNYQYPKNIALLSQNGRMYYVLSGEKQRIGTAGMDGSDPQILIDVNDYRTVMTLDTLNERLYWTDSLSIRSARIDGSDQRVILKSEQLKFITGLSIFENKVYWANESSINACNKFTGEEQEVIIASSRQLIIGSLEVYHAATKPKISHACENNPCSHMCLLAPNNSYTCSCPIGMILAKDSTHCIGSAKIQNIYVGFKDTIVEMEITTSGRQRIMKKYQLPMHVNFMKYNHLMKTIIIGSSDQKIIKEFNPDNNRIKNLVSRKIGNITGMALDNAAQNLYWTDSEKQVVEMLSLRNKQRAIVHSFPGTDKPVGVGIVSNGILSSNSYFSGEENPLNLLIAMQSASKLYLVRKSLASLNGTETFEKIVHEVKAKRIFKLFNNHPNGQFGYVDTEAGEVIHLHFGFDRITSLIKYFDKLSSIVKTRNEDMFWTVLKTPYIYWEFKENIGKEKRIDIKTILGIDMEQKIHFIPIVNFDEGHNHSCRVENGGCSHICASSGKELSSICMCPLGYVYGDYTNMICVQTLSCEYRCKSGECLTASKLCNGFIDCLGNEDEEDCEDFGQAKSNNEIFNNATEESFQCLTGTFISKSWQCDGEVDCMDGSDERGCVSESNSNITISENVIEETYSNGPNPEKTSSSLIDKETLSKIESQAIDNLLSMISKFRNIDTFQLSKAKSKILQVISEIEKK